MRLTEWKDEMIGDPSDLVETEWDAELDHRLKDVMTGKVELVDHIESMRLARERLASGAVRRAVA